MNQFLHRLKAVDLITDYSQDGNASPKVERRLLDLFGKPVVKWTAQEDDTFGAQIVEILAITDEWRLLFVNKAWRDGKTENGDPFGYIHLENALIFTTFGQYLAEVQRHSSACYFHPFDTDAIFSDDAKHQPWSLSKRFRTSQFRSFDWLPFLGHAVAAGEKVPTLAPIALPAPEERPDRIWWIDNYGNAKTLLRFPDLLPERQRHHTQFKTEKDILGTSVRTIIGDLKCYPHMTAVPRGEVGLVLGSSGARNPQWRYLEVQIHGGHAAEVYPQLKVGANLLV